MTHQTAMTDLQCVEYAAQSVLAKCQKANPHHMSPASDGETVMKLFAEALNEAKAIRDGHGECQDKKESINAD